PGAGSPLRQRRTALAARTAAAGRHRILGGRPDRLRGGRAFRGGRHPRRADLDGAAGAGQRPGAASPAAAGYGRPAPARPAAAPPADPVFRLGKPADTPGSGSGGRHRRRPAQPAGPEPGQNRRIARPGRLRTLNSSRRHRRSIMNPRLGVREDDLEIAAAIGRYAAAEIAPLAAELDEQSRSATCHVPGLSALGVMGMNLPERWGGAGVSPTALVLSIVEIARRCAATSSMIGAHYLATDSILIGADDDLRAHYLPRAARGDILGAFALTEPRAGSNPADMSTRARREGDQYHLNGVKHFISNAGEADFIVVYAKTDPQAGSRGISAFIVDKDTPGLQVSRPEKLMGIRGGHAFEVALDCRVPASRRLGEEGSGFRTAMKVLDNSRLDVAATSLGIAEAALEAAVSWSRERLIGGQPL